VCWGQFSSHGFRSVNTQAPTAATTAAVATVVTAITAVHCVGSAAGYGIGRFDSLVIICTRGLRPPLTLQPPGGGFVLAVTATDMAAIVACRVRVYGPHAVEHYLQTLDFSDWWRIADGALTACTPTWKRRFENLQFSMNTPGHEIDLLHFPGTRYAFYISKDPTHSAKIIDIHSGLLLHKVSLIGDSVAKALPMTAEYVVCPLRAASSCTGACRPSGRARCFDAQILRSAAATAVGHVSASYAAASCECTGTFDQSVTAERSPHILLPRYSGSPIILHDVLNARALARPDISPSFNSVARAAAADDAVPPPWEWTRERVPYVWARPIAHCDRNGGGTSP